MTTLEDVVQAYREIAASHERYRQTLREALANGVKQADVAKALGITRESVRQDAMTDEQRAAHRKAATERERRRRAAKAAQQPPR